MSTVPQQSVPQLSMPSHPIPPQSIPQWSGREVRALREARRMSVREFAAHLGVSDRVVSKWEAGGGAIRPRPLNQAALDTSLAMASPAEKSRFTLIAVGAAAHVPPQRVRGILDAAPALRHLARHPVDGRLMTMVDGGPFVSANGKRVWLPGFFIDLHPATNADYTRFATSTGRDAPRHWPNGICPTSLLDQPVTSVGWLDAKAYAVWASKSLPTTDQWDRAAGGDEGMTVGSVAEWCSVPTGPVRRQPRTGGGGHETGFRCATPAREMLALLAI